MRFALVPLYSPRVLSGLGLKARRPSPGLQRGVREAARAGAALWPGAGSAPNPLLIQTRRLALPADSTMDPLGRGLPDLEVAELRFALGRLAETVPVVT